MSISRIIFNILSIVLLTLTALGLIACDPAAKSASQAFDNANSLIKTGSETLFMENEATPTPLSTPLSK